MAKRKKSGSGGVFGIVLIGTLVLLAAIPKEVWLFVVALGAVALLLYMLRPAQSSNVTQAEVHDDIPVSVRPASSPGAQSFRLPSAPEGFGAGAWIPAGQAVEVAGITIPGGMVYFGRSLKTPYSNSDPCLIDPSKPVAQVGEYATSQMGYWPRYSEISSENRRAYLMWLAGGRKDPSADIGYVFLFFYGLERRAIVDANDDPATRSDWPQITEELRRLLSIYGDKSNSFRRYASELLDWLSLAEFPVRMYEKPLPPLTKSFELPLYVRLALGQAALDGEPVPAVLALAWAKLDPNRYLRTPATRCEEQFDLLFVEKYAELFGAGMVLPRNRTKLKFVYRPASSGFRGAGDICLTYGDTPDVTVLTAPLKKLHQVVEAATKDLEAYSRFVGKNPEGRSSLEGLLQLPVTLWPEAAQKTIEDLRVRMGDGMVTLTLQDLLTTLDAKSALTKDRALALARALESRNIGIEPDVLDGAKMPKAEDQVVLFAVSPGDATSRSTATYQAAALTLQLASAVASADGEFGPKELGHLREQVQSWTHLTPNHIRRLLAHIHLLTMTPVSLTVLKKKLEPLDTAAKEAIAAFMTTVAQADGEVSPAEVKILEKVYKALGLEPKRVFSDLHAVAADTSPTRSANAEVPGPAFQLDAARIAALQQDTAKVSSLLANIFREEDARPPSAPEPEAEPAEEAKGLLGLDEVHSALARMLLSRHQWTREELQDVSADMDLMLDGALECINEAAFDTHDMPFLEGEDPVTVNMEILEKLDA